MDSQQPVANTQLTPEETKKPPLKWIIIFLIIAVLTAIVYLLIFQFKINLLQLNKPVVPASPAPETILNTTIDKKETVLTKFTSEADFKSYLSEGNNRSTSGAYFGSSVLENRIRAVPGANIGAVMETQSLPQAGGGAPERVSETNVQVKGIDEPDILKTDGKSLFFSSENQYYPAPAVRIMGNTSVIPPYELPQGRLKIINSLPADKIAVFGNI